MCPACVLLSVLVLYTIDCVSVCLQVYFVCSCCCISANVEICKLLQKHFYEYLQTGYTRAYIYHCIYVCLVLWLCV